MPFRLPCLAALALLVAGSAAAQTAPADVFSLAVGNRWVYDNVEILVGQNGEVDTYPSGETRWEVVRTADTPDGELPVLEVRSGVAVRLCAVESTADADGVAFAFHSLEGQEPCPAQAYLTPASEPLTVTFDLLNQIDVQIGGVTYVDLDVADGEWAPAGSGLRDGYYRLALGIGVLDFTLVDSFGPGSTSYHSALRYAEVDGEVYGTPPTAGEGVPEATALALAVGPNPARGAARLTLSGEGPVQISVLDALGRVVARRDAATGTLELDTSGWAAGAYAVRAEAGGEAAWARLTVVR